MRSSSLPFLGTATSVVETGSPVLGGTVTFHVDHWYKGGQGEVVILENWPVKAERSTYDIVEGRRYLISTRDGRVDSCFQTAPASPEMQQWYDEAFPPRSQREAP